MSSDHHPPRRYNAPALEKGLDILELLAQKRHGMTQSALAADLGKSVGELFRMLAVLEERGYIYREPPQDLYFLSLRLYEMANRHPPTKRLLDVAVPEMRTLAESARQSVHLGVPSEGELLIIAQVESPEPAGVTVRIGRRSLVETASGRVLLAFQDRETQTRWLGDELFDETPLRHQLDQIRIAGLAQVDGESLKGVIDISVPLLDVHGCAIAALTVPLLLQQTAQPSAEDVGMMAIAAGARISARTHGSAG